MSEPGFLQRHRATIVGVVAASTAVITAYYCYRQLGGNNSGDSPEARKKKSKKKSKKNGGKSKSGITGTATTSNINLDAILSGSELNQSEVQKLSNEDKEKYALALKDRGNALFKANKCEEAISSYEMALQLKKDPVFYSNISACYISLDRLDKVVEASTKALELKPDYSKALLRRATAYEGLDRYDDAMCDLSLLSLNGDFNSASIEPMLERNLNKQAMKVLKDKLVTDDEVKELPSNTSMASFFGVLKCEVADSPKEFNDNDEADRTLLEALKNIYKPKTGSFELADKHLERASKLLSTKLESNGSDDTLKFKTALALSYQGIFKFLKNDLMGARDILNKSLEIYPTPNTYIFMALTVADNGQDDGYSALFNKAIELDPKASSVYYHRGQLYFIMQDYDKAKQDFNKAQECDPENLFPYIQLACLAHRQDQHDECEKLFEQATKKFPTAPEVPTFHAEILADKGELDSACKQYDIAKRLEEVQSHIRVGVAPLVGKATALARQPAPENLELAASLLETACECDPRSEQAKVGLAQLKLQQEDVDKAIELFEDAARLARTADDKLQATTFAEASKVQKKIRENPVAKAKIEEALASYRAQGLF